MKYIVCKSAVVLPVVVSLVLLFLRCGPSSPSDDSPHGEFDGTWRTETYGVHSDSNGVILDITYNFGPSDGEILILRQNTMTSYLVQYQCHTLTTSNFTVTGDTFNGGLYNTLRPITVGDSTLSIFWTVRHSPDSLVLVQHLTVTTSNFSKISKNETRYLRHGGQVPPSTWPPLCR